MSGLLDALQKYSVSPYGHTLCIYGDLRLSSGSQAKKKKEKKWQYFYEKNAKK